LFSEFFRGFGVDESCDLCYYLGWLTKNKSIIFFDFRIAAWGTREGKFLIGETLALSKPSKVSSDWCSARIINWRLIPMSVEFLHIADVHLGYQQYGHKERFNDFARSFEWAIDYAVEHQVDFVLISGDLFHQSAIEPLTLWQAVSLLDKLREAHITVIGIAGNHDKVRYRDTFSWLRFLAKSGYLILLSPDFCEDGFELDPAEENEGAYIDLGCVRVFGIPHLGASIHPLLTELPQKMAAIDDSTIAFKVLMAHTAIEGEMPRSSGGLTANELASLREHIDYLALGHLHKPFERGDWIYNPGSLEICEMGDRKWHGGFYHVIVEPNKVPKHTVKHVKSHRRPFHRLRFAVDSYTNPLDLMDGLQSQLKVEKARMTQSELSPVVEVSLEGVLNFDRHDLDLNQVQELTHKIVSPLITKVRNATRPVGFEIAPEEHQSWAELEHAVLRDLALRDGRYQKQANEWATLMAHVKTLALAGDSPEMITLTVRQHKAKMAEAKEDVD
jgi:DNA repair exonuclease SbcCD nuclease subunit